MQTLGSTVENQLDATIGTFCWTHSLTWGFFLITQIGIGAEVWAFAPGNKYGSWWAAMIAVVSGIIAVIASNK